MSDSLKPESLGAIAATAMFIEVLVVGIGSLAAMVGFVTAIVGFEFAKQVAPILSSTPAAGVGLAFAYALGIMIDRGSDFLLRSPRRRLRGSYFDSSASYDQARRAIVNNPHIIAMSDYARSRMRICRGWFVNSIFLTVATNLVIWRFPVPDRIITGGWVTAIGLLLTWGFYAAWRSITATGYKKLAQQTAICAGTISARLPNR
ncbi:hypothetical protein [Streptomyces paromomycinus]|uniref:hypothetical protein n=1 Tax=Streptomyces paromomycinus TaxID=92743 RepID=UPI000F6188AB|nr:hypothetical protein [Streptomyces paromomycinus]